MFTLFFMYTEVRTKLGKKSKKGTPLVVFIKTILTVNITRGSKILVLMDENASCLLKLLLFIVFSV